jgi:YfiR/HmsC-like
VRPHSHRLWAADPNAKRRRIAPWIIALILLNIATGKAQSQRELEYRLKAVYLFNFLQFSEWPDSAFADARAPIVLGVVGNDPFGTVLDEVVQSEKVGVRPITLVRFRTGDEITKCQALFVCSSEKDNCQTILDGIQGSPTLTVSEISGFNYLGGCIRFYVENNKLRFEINLKAVNHARLKMSSKLLRLARIINPS